MRSGILVTGGSGFIGTHLCRILRKSGYSVRVLDLRAPTDSVEGVEYLRGDIRNPEVMEQAVRDTSSVYHFAAMVSVAMCQEQPVESYRTNLLGTVQVLEAVHRESLRAGRKVRVFFAGSSAVYGNTGDNGTPLVETDVRDEPRSFYAAQKLGSEHAIRGFCRTYGIPALVFRFFNVFGPGQDPSSPYSGVISIFSKRIAEEAPLSVNGGGAQTRDFVSVHDIARACSSGLQLPEERCDGRALNLGTGNSITIRKLAEEMMDVSSRRVELISTPWREGDVVHSLADISLAKEFLGWAPEVPLRDGLRELLCKQH